MTISSLVKDIRLYRAIARNGLGEKYLQVQVLDEPEGITHAQRFHAEVYLKRGFVQPGEIGADGRLTLFADPHQEHAEYFVILGEGGKSDVRVVSRQIRMDPKKGFGSFPILDQAQIYERSLSDILKYDPAACVEISALAKRPGASPLLALMLYRAMLHHSVKAGDKLWLMACDVRLYQRLKLLFGSAIVQIGRVTPYYGGDVVPAMLKLDEALAGLITGTRDKLPLRKLIRKTLPQFFLTGYPKDLISAGEYEDLKRLGYFIK